MQLFRWSTKGAKNQNPLKGLNSSFLLIKKVIGGGMDKNIPIPPLFSFRQYPFMILQHKQVIVKPLYGFLWIQFKILPFHPLSKQPLLPSYPPF